VLIAAGELVAFALAANVIAAVAFIQANAATQIDRVACDGVAIDRVACDGVAIDGVAIDRLARTLSTVIRSWP
jgi:hypothetical protein